METPLIAEEGRGFASGLTAAFSSRRRQQSGVHQRRRSFFSRDDALTLGDNYQKAAALVDLADDGVGLPEEILNDKRFEKAAKFYFIYIRLDLLWSLNLFAIVVLNFLEKPLWCQKNGSDVCVERKYYFLGQLPYLNERQSLTYEGITLLILTIYNLFPLAYEGLHRYWENNLNKLKVVLLLVLVCDMLVYSLCLSNVLIFLLPLRVAPYVRIIFVILSVRHLYGCMLTLAGMAGTYLNILALSTLFLLFSSWLAYVIFEDTEQGESMFTSYGTTLYQMFVLFTTSNNPDVWVPAYKSSRWSCIFFVLYILLGVYFLTNLILAVVYDSFKNQLAKQVFQMDLMRKNILEKAFNLINVSGYLNKQQCSHLFEELNEYRSLPKISKEDFELIFEELDDSGDFKINLEEFTDLCNAIALRFQREAVPSWFENYPTFYRSRPCEMLKAFVRSTTFANIVGFVLIINLVAVVIETTLDIQNSSAQKFWQEIEFFFGWIYVLEMALKIFSFGFDAYWMDGQNQFDFVITWTIVIGETLTFASPSTFPFLLNGEWIRYLLIARMLRLLRLLQHVKQYKAYVTTFLTLIPSLMPYLGTIFCVLCIYCSLGVQLFGGIVNAGNTELASTDLSDSDYLLFNFNDYPNGMVTLFNLLVMGNWQVWMQSYSELTGTYWTLIYFISFYLITVLLLLNLVVAFILEAFFAEMDLESANEPNEDAPERKGRRRLTGASSRNRTVDILLHRILSAELEESQNAEA
ncbi:two pore calcium channel protein 1 [Zingiber officinale]|uniref:two pore calcium channel protein 1 n=1 Tax=Zingiber officinale TaxID=94328 RepID=UPI001C4BC87E|nr:two pore calcium channel protein 1 [Zingiber officinale]